MTGSTYLIRFDDICPTMNWTVWGPIETQLRRHGIRPIMAVIPDNQDPKLVKEPARADFWDRVRDWKSLGWSIALHGYQHVYVNKNPGIMGLTKQSEFAGLSREEQEAKLKNGLAVFASQGLRPDAWIGPSHSFDHTTLDLLVGLGVPVISDGLWRWPFRDRSGAIWVPQQLWDFEPRNTGVWTVCNHHNSWTPRNVEEFSEDLAAYAPRISDLASVVERYGARELTLGDRCAAFCELMWNHRRRAWHAYVRQRVLALRSRSA